LSLSVSNRLVISQKIWNRLGVKLGECEGNPVAANKLSARRVDTLKEPGTYMDGDGLRLKIGQSGRKSWVYRYMRQGRQHDMGLGSYPAISLAEARIRRDGYVQQLARGIDPLEEKQRLQSEARQREGMTFAEAARRFISDYQSRWTNQKHASQWTNTLERYVMPVLGQLPVCRVAPADVVTVLRPIWGVKHETASRVRQRIEKIMAWAIASGHASPPNPATWKGTLEFLLPKLDRVVMTQHFPALPIREAPAFYQRLCALDGYAALGFRWLMLHASRTTEVRLARWEEIDLDRRIWTIPASRMKWRKVHQVPLSSEAMVVLEHCAQRRQSEYLFPGLGADEGLSNGAFLSILKKQFPEVEAVPHGMRSTFRDWAEEQGCFSHFAIETCLAHSVKNAVEKAYLRTTVLEMRRDMLQAWANYLLSDTDD
jgi:integrase